MCLASLLETTEIHPVARLAPFGGPARIAAAPAVVTAEIVTTLNGDGWNVKAAVQLTNTDRARNAAPSQLPHDTIDGKPCRDIPSVFQGLDFL